MQILVVEFADEIAAEHLGKADAAIGALPLTSCSSVLSNSPMVISSSVNRAMPAGAMFKTRAGR